MYAVHQSQHACVVAYWWVDEAWWASRAAAISRICFFKWLPLGKQEALLRNNSALVQVSKRR